MYRRSSKRNTTTTTARRRKKQGRFPCGLCLHPDTLEAPGETPDPEAEVTHAKWMKPPEIFSQSAAVSDCSRLAGCSVCAGGGGGFLRQEVSDAEACAADPDLHLAPLVSSLSLAALLNPRQEKDTKSFSFDYSYWSHTSVTLLPPTCPHLTGCEVSQDGS